MTIQVEADERFERHGDDLLSEVHIGIAEAALGCTVDVEGILPDEHFELEVPAGTQYGEALVVDGNGMPRLGTGSRGRFVARIVVDVPTKLSDDAREALERFAEAAGENASGSKKHRTMGDRIRDAIDEILDTKLSDDAREALERFAEAAGENASGSKKHRTMGDRIRDAIDEILD